MDNKEIVILAGKGGGGGGGAEPGKFIVTVTESSGNYSANKTVTEIATAYAAGKTPIVMFNGKVFALTLDAGSATPGFNFTFAEAESNQRGNIQTLTVDDSDLWELYDVYTAPAETVVDVSGATPTITPAANRTYKCGELTSLTITDPPATGAYSIVFTSGATATTTTIPATILGLESFAPEANTIYEINVLDNRAVIGSWAVSA